MKDRFSMKRIWNLFFLFVVTAAAVLFLCIRQDLFFDQILNVVYLGLIWFVLFLLFLEHERTKGLICQNRETDFKKVVYGYTACALLVVGCSFLPEFTKPLLFLPVVMTAVSSARLALVTGIFWDVLLCVILGCSAQELSLYCLLTLFGTLLADTAGDNIKEKKSLLFHQIILFCISFMLPAAFYYLAYQEFFGVLLLWGAAGGVLCVLWMQFAFQHFFLLQENEILYVITDILDDGYPLVRELANFSKQEYQHACRVSKISEQCAKVVHANERICAAAGFYYRIGILQGGSFAKSGVQIAQESCFPEEVIKILGEYNGEEALPSSIESAIVHMVNGLVKKLEVFDSQTMASEWNRDMVIYQTLNEYSANGIYDSSGLGMNMFLKIREYLVNEPSLF